MALKRTVEESSGVPAGVYAMSVTKLEEDDGEYGAQIKFYFNIDKVISTEGDDPDEYINEEKWGWCSDNLTPNTKLFRWYKALVGVEPSLDDDVDLEDMLFCKCIGTIARNKNNKLTLTDIQPYRAPAKKKKKKAAPKPAPEPEPEEEDEDPEGFEDEEDDDDELEDF